MDTEPHGVAPASHALPVLPLHNPHDWPRSGDFHGFPGRRRLCIIPPRGSGVNPLCDLGASKCDIVNGDAVVDTRPHHPHAIWRIVSISPHGGFQLLESEHSSIEALAGLPLLYGHDHRRCPYPKYKMKKATAECKTPDAFYARKSATRES